MNNHYARSLRDFNSTNTGPNSLVEGSSSSLTFQDIHDQFTETVNDVEFIAEDVQEEVQQIPMGCEQQNIVQSASEVREAAADGDDFHFDDFALFDSSSIGVYEFSREFLAIARRHRFQPKAKAILLDLLQRIMPKDNRCPKTIAEMRKLVTCNEHAYNELFQEKSAFFSNSTALKVSETIRPQLHYLLPQQPSTSSDNKLLNIKREIAGPSIIYGLDEHPANNNRDLLPYVLQTIDRLSQEVSVLRMSLSTQVPRGSLRKTNRRTACSSDERAGIRVYDVADKVVLLNSLARQELQRTVDVSRYDANRLIYDQNDITEIILDKIELSSYMHNPSLCGRMVADILFSPEFLSNKHILAEGQFSSRARLEVLPPEMTHLFYESLRKLGVSRIIEEDREYWLYLARDGVNQRARDLKAKRKRKFYTDEHPPIFTTEEQIK